MFIPLKVELSQIHGVIILSLGCNHCEQPKCAENCPTGSIYKREKDGLVVQDQEKCIGCKMCLWSCPFEQTAIH